MAKPPAQRKREKGKKERPMLGECAQGEIELVIQGE
jgi:hypothetical protein